MLHTLKRYIPRPALQAYHYFLARLAAFIYRHPSRRMIVIGVTGTNGKSSTVQLIEQLLTELGKTVGYTSTAGFSIAGEEVENRMKMTMPGRFYLQSMLARMYRSGCEYVIVETSSQGIEQFRHLGIAYDTAVFTNLTPEHIEAHGGFENYKAQKLKLFKVVEQRTKKVFNGIPIPRSIVVNADDEHANDFARFNVDRVWRFGQQEADAELTYRIVAHETGGTRVQIGESEVLIPLLADFQIKNAMAAMGTMRSLGFSHDAILGAMQKLQSIPGRFEAIHMGQPFHVIVDYAYEPYALMALFDAVKGLQPKRIIGIHGSAGGGRDIARREKIGALAAEREDIVIVTNEDPYDEDPRQIIEMVADGARAHGVVEGEDLFLIDDRADAIRFAMQQAQEGDVVLLTAKGSEPVMAVADGKKIPWDDREQARKALSEMGYSL